MIEVKLFKKRYQLPANWDEIPYKILAKVAPVLFQHNSQAFPFALVAQYIPAKILDRLPEEYLECLLNLVTWTSVNTFCPDITEWRIRPRTFAKPQLSISPNRISIFELAYCHFYIRYLDKEASIEKALDEITFTLLRKPGTEYSEDLKLRNQKKYGKSLSVNQKLLVTMWFIGWYRTTIQERYFPKKDPDPEGSTSEDGNEPDYGYFPLILNLAQSGIYGTYEQVCKIPAHTVFFNQMLFKNQKE